MNGKNVFNHSLTEIWFIWHRCCDSGIGQLWFKLQIFEGYSLSNDSLQQYKKQERSILL